MGPRRRPRRRTLIIIGIVGAVVLLLGGLAIAGVTALRGLTQDFAGGEADLDPAAGEPVEVTVDRRDLVDSVAATGTLSTSRALALGFPGPGRVVELTVAVGDQVTAGQVLARQDDRLARLELDEAQAALAEAERAAGLRRQEGATTESAVDRARTAVAAASAELSAAEAVAGANTGTYDTAVLTAEATRDRAVAARNAALESADAAAAAQASTVAVAAAQQDLTAARTAAAAARDETVAAGQAVTAATASGDATALATAEARLAAAELAVDATTADVADAQGELDALQATRGTASQAREAAAAAEAAAFDAEQAVRQARDARTVGRAQDDQLVTAARNALATARADLRAARTGGPEPSEPATSAEQLRIAVARAELQVEQAQADVDRLTIVAPVAGTVTRVGAAAGEVLGEGRSGDAADDDTTDPSAVITISTVEQLLAEITLPEADAVDVQPGMPVDLKFTALPGVVGQGRVLSVSPVAATAQPQGAIDQFTGEVSTGRQYTVAIQLVDPPDGIRGGLGIAARITLGEASQVLVVPTAALSQSDGTTLVQRVGPDDATEDVEIEIGIRQGGWTQVISGLTEGDVVLTVDEVGVEDEAFFGG